MKLNTFTQFQLLLEAQSSLRLNLPKDIVSLHSTFKKSGRSLYVVGGAVRDALLGKKPKDFDLATDAPPDEVVKIVNRAGYSTIGEVGQKFGVVIVQLPSDPNGVEIATFRIDIGSGRRPNSVKYSTIDQDVKRRDLTINALFYDIDQGKVVDLVGGVPDIQSGLIRTVGVPSDRFAEDPLRKLRALRFAARMGSKLEPETAAAISNDNNLKGVSPERIRDEFKKSIESAKSPKTYLQMISDFTLWSVMFPGLQINQNFTDSNRWLVQLAMLFGSNRRELIQKEMNQLTFTRDEIDAVIVLQTLLEFKPVDVFDMWKQLDNAGLEDAVVLEFAKLNRLDLKLIKALLKFTPTIDGNWVMQEFGTVGPATGKKIKELEAEKFMKEL
jgi:tRNA nucleotidyltransferase/poly(A) polymerase